MSTERDWTGHDAEMRAMDAYEHEAPMDLSSQGGYTTVELNRYAGMTDDEVRDSIRQFDALFGQARDVEAVLATIRRAIRAIR